MAPMTDRKLGNGGWDEPSHGCRRTVNGRRVLIRGPYNT